MPVVRSEQRGCRGTAPGRCLPVHKHGGSVAEVTVLGGGRRRSLPGFGVENIDSVGDIGVAPERTLG